jgi:hypothetical protein
MAEKQTKIRLLSNYLWKSQANMSTAQKKRVLMAKGAA